MEIFTENVSRWTIPSMATRTKQATFPKQEDMQNTECVGPNSTSIRPTEELKERERGDIAINTNLNTERQTEGETARARHFHSATTRQTRCKHNHIIALVAQRSTAKHSPSRQSTLRPIHHTTLQHTTPTIHRQAIFYIALSFLFCTLIHCLSSNHKFE